METSHSGREHDGGRVAMLEAILISAGEVGFSRLSIAEVCRRASRPLADYYSSFPDQEQGFVAAYQWKANAVADLVIAEIKGRGTTATRVQNALEVLSGFAMREEAVARAVAGEVHAAGLEAGLRRREVLRRVVRSLEQECRFAKGEHSAVSTKAEFCVAGIDHAFTTAVLIGEPAGFQRAIPDLVALLSAALEPEPAPGAQPRLVTEVKPGRAERGRQR